MLLAALVAACASGPTPAPTPTPPAAAPLFDFHSGFWEDVHHRLHHAATARRPPAQPAAPAWTAAVAYYRQRFGARGGRGLFDDDLIAIHRQLGGLGSDPHLTGLDPELTAILESAAEVVRADWPAQDRANRAWIAAVEPLLARHGADLRAALEKAYGVPWPAAPIRVDVTSAAGSFGAYTIEGPPHIVISSRDPSYGGDASLEMLFHEASHVLVAPVEQAIAAASARLGRHPPDDLWHAVLFYTAGELARRVLGDGYVPYARKNGVWQRAWNIEAELERDWRPYLDGATSRDAAIDALVADVAR
jgi:hypothetical protein